MPKKEKTVKEPSLAQQAQEAQQAKKEKLASTLEGSEAGAIWLEIKDMGIEMFALPGQTVAMHCNPVPADPSRLFLVTASTAALPSLEVAINKNAKGEYLHRFDVELADRFVIVSRVPVSLTEKWGIK